MTVGVGSSPALSSTAAQKSREGSELFRDDDPEDSEVEPMTLHIF